MYRSQLTLLDNPSGRYRRALILVSLAEKIHSALGISGHTGVSAGVGRRRYCVVHCDTRVSGLSVLNGMAYGCIPIVPDRLAYKDIIPSNWRYPSRMEAPKQEAYCLVDCLLRLSKKEDTPHVSERLLRRIFGMCWQNTTNSIS